MDRAVPAASQAPLALLSILVMVFLMITGIVPNVIAALIGCLLLGYFRCIDSQSAYQSIHWQSLILIIGMMPFSIALQKTGGIALAVDGMLQLVQGWSMYAVLMVLFLFTAIVGLFSRTNCYQLSGKTLHVTHCICYGGRYCRLQCLYDTGLFTGKYHGAWSRRLPFQRLH